QSGVLDRDGRVVQQQRQRLGKITDGVVAGFDQPVGVAGLLGNPGAQFAGRGDACAGAADLAASQQPQRPGGIVRRRVAEVVDQRGTLVSGAGAAVQALVEGGEATHQSSSP